MEKSSSKVGNESRSFRGKSVGLFLPLLWIFSFFLNIGFDAEVPLTESNQSLLVDFTTTVHSDDVDSFSPDPSSPTPSNPVSDEPIESDEEEKEDSLEDDWKSALKTSFYYNSLFEKVLTKNLSQSFQNRKTVPLFILFHSWKSFLS